MALNSPWRQAPPDSSTSARLRDLVPTTRHATKWPPAVGMPQPNSLLLVPTMVIIAGWIYSLLVITISLLYAVFPYRHHNMGQRFGRPRLPIYSPRPPPEMSAASVNEPLCRALPLSRNQPLPNPKIALSQSPPVPKLSNGSSIRSCRVQPPSAKRA